MGDVWKFTNTDVTPSKYIGIRLLRPGDALHCHIMHSTFLGSA